MRDPGARRGAGSSAPPSRPRRRGGRAPARGAAPSGGGVIMKARGPTDDHPPHKRPPNKGHLSGVGGDGGLRGAAAEAESCRTEALCGTPLIEPICLYRI